MSAKDEDEDDIAEIDAEAVGIDSEPQPDFIGTAERRLQLREQLLADIAQLTDRYSKRPGGEDLAALAVAHLTQAGTAVECEARVLLTERRKGWFAPIALSVGADALRRRGEQLSRSQRPEGSGACPCGSCQAARARQAALN